MPKSVLLSRPPKNVACRSCGPGIAARVVVREQHLAVVGGDGPSTYCHPTIRPPSSSAPRRERRRRILALREHVLQSGILPVLRLPPRENDEEGDQDDEPCAETSAATAQPASDRTSQFGPHGTSLAENPFFAVEIIFENDDHLSPSRGLTCLAGPIFLVLARRRFYGETFQVNCRSGSALFP
jgi:hypothetical protein